MRLVNDKYIMRQFMKLFETFVPQGLEDEVAEIAYQNTDWGGGDGEGFIADYARWQGVRDDYDGDDPLGDTISAAEKIDIDSPEFKSWFRSEIMDRCGDAEWSIEKRFRENNGTLRIFRVITAPSDWKPDSSRHPGIWWSWDSTKADAHWGSFNADHIQWMLEATVSPSEINWPATLSANALMPEEAEIQLKKEAPVELVRAVPYEDFESSSLGTT